MRDGNLSHHQHSHRIWGGVTQHRGGGGTSHVKTFLRIYFSISFELRNGLRGGGVGSVQNLFCSSGWGDCSSLARTPELVVRDHDGG